MISDNKIKEIAIYLINNGQTVRGASKVFNISKSSIHKYITNDLENIDYNLFLRVKELLKYNKKVKHIRGGNSTKIKYQNRSKNNCKIIV